jgi:superfamily II DNA or RNA helicase
MEQEFYEQILAILTIPNPKYADAMKQGRSVAKIPRELLFYRENDDCSITIPRGFFYELKALVDHAGLKVEIDDRRRLLPACKITFYGKLRPHQLQAVKGLVEKDFGVSHIPTGGGKTIVALWLIAHRKQPALVVVHTRELLNQWIDRVETFLGIPRKKIGVVGNGKFRIGAEVTIATIQSLVSRTEDLKPLTGFLILDECHRVPAMQYIEAVKQFDCKYMLGLTATPTRRDGLSKAIFWHIGEITGQIAKQDLLDDETLCEAEVVWVKTSFDTDIDASSNYSQALAALTRDPLRNKLICDTLLSRRNGGIDLVLSDRRQHCQVLSEMLERTGGINTAVLTGDKSEKQRGEIMDALHQGRITTLIATGQLIGEGFDLPGLTTLYLTTPVKFSGRIIQYVGRILRPTEEKTKAVIVDFVDVKNPVFKASATSRFYTYKQQGIVEQHSIN